jgi:hypothetical protein
MENLYTVWVGGVEVNDQYLTEQQAEQLANDYRNVGHEDVIIEKE